MTKFKLDIIGLSAIAAILTLICTSCAKNPIDPKINGYTNSKENTENFENKSENFASENQKERKDTIAKLKEFGNKLETQKNEETTKIAKNLTGDHFVDLVGVYPVYYGKDKEAKEKLEKAIKTKLDVVSAEIQKTEKLQIERIIQASLNYDTEKINKLKEILETLKGSEEHKDQIRLLLYNKALDIQKQLDEYLELIKKDSELNAISLQKLKELLMHVEFDLMLKEKFKETLKKTVEEVHPKIQQNKKNREDYILGHIADNYLIFDYSTQSAKFKQKNFNQIKNKII
ncbi:complement regulator-acquiring protein (plasmid) [Borreliella andersonii]|uniref:Complement regulator-acquiring protein n=1 Tax=Borrelia andersonii TaxID=42109 RepID=A0ABZ0CGC4_BORAD|nr:complement regulator-acquiring protein [Borreliella andersonii]WNY66387.1 complement regulator-acquiring protein [Borreliella andersonii]